MTFSVIQATAEANNLAAVAAAKDLFNKKMEEVREPRYYNPTKQLNYNKYKKYLLKATSYLTYLHHATSRKLQKL